MRSPRAGRSPGPLCALAALLVPAAAAAFDPFEIQVYDGTSDAKGHGGIEVHLNRHGGQTRVTLEPSYGVTRFWEIGGYLQSADGRYEGVKLRTKLVAGDDVVGPFRLGVNFELSREPSGWGGEVRPIAAYETRRWLLVFNPIVSFPAAFEPAAMAKLKLGHVGIGVEYYSSLPGEHYLFEAADLVEFRNVEINVAFGQGLTARSENLLAKMILGYTF